METGVNNGVMKMDNYETAKWILKTLGVKGEGKECPGMPCDECDKLGPKDGKPCMSLKLAKDMGYVVTVPKWCKDPEELQKWRRIQ